MPADRPRLLIVDDQPAVARALARMLAQHADSVVVDSGREALSMLLRGERFDWVLSDVMMPEMTGTELFERAVAIDAALARSFVFITGGATDAEHARVVATGATRLAKPIDLAAIRRVLGL